MMLAYLMRSKHRAEMLHGQTSQDPSLLSMCLMIGGTETMVILFKHLFLCVSLAIILAERTVIE